MTSSEALILKLGDVGRDDLAVAGGKGANLGELIRVGSAVPAGFVVSTAAYRQFGTANDLNPKIARAVKGRDAESIRAAFEAGAIPSDTAEAIRTAYGDLGAGAVAVRSSATAEDLADAAFAGQQDTFLNVLGVDAVLDAVRRCWASLWTDRAFAYREQQGIDQQDLQIAVVVQRMIPADAAGVLFTANPVSGARDEIVVDANPGLGEAVVSGLVTPDHFRLRKLWWGWSVAERRPGKREIVVRARDNGGTQHVTVPSTERSVPDRALRQLARLGKAIEAHFGAPQDIEWAWWNGRVWILQARPITALPEPRPRWSRLQRQAYTILTEVMPRRPLPLDATAWGPAVFGAIEPFFRMMGMRVGGIQAVLTEEDGVPVRPGARGLMEPGPGMLGAPARILGLAHRYDSTHWKDDPALAGALALVHELEAQDMHAMSWPQLLEALHTAMDIPRQIAGEIRVRYFPRAALAFGLLAVMLRPLGHARAFGRLLSGVETKTIAANRALESLAATISADAALAEIFTSREAEDIWTALEASSDGEALLAQLRAFLAEYGNREAFITGASQPTWREAPEIVFGILKGLVAGPARSEADPHAWKTARDEILRHPLLRIRRLRSLFLATLDEARVLMQLREDTHFYATLALPLFRRTALEMGGRLVEADALEAPDDVFFLRLEELEAIAKWPLSTTRVRELRDLVGRRKKRYAALVDTPLFDPRLLAPPVTGEALVTGTPGSPGVAEGPVRVVRSGSEFGKLRPGEVLVAPFTNPAWTPLFQRAVAVVVDAGSAASHAAIVAREYHIPAVMGAGDATIRLQDGQLVRVDGDHGLVLSASE